MPVMVEGVYGPATTEEKDTLHQQMKALDSKQEGLTLNQFRVFYPRIPWGELLTILRELKADGRAKAEIKPLKQGSAQSFEHWSWL